MNATITTHFVKGIGRNHIRVTYRRPGRIFSATYRVATNDGVDHLQAVAGFLDDFAGCYPETGMWDGVQTKPDVWTWKVEG